MRTVPRHPRVPRAAAGVTCVVLLLSGCAIADPTRASTPPGPAIVSTTPRATPSPTPGPTLRPEDAGRLDPRLADAFAAAQAEGTKHGFTFSLNSDYRSAADQRQLWDEGIVKHGSVEEARKWVSTPWDSAHVRGTALDIQGTPEGQKWLWDNQARFGLCRRYDNEPWHFELRASFPDDTCPPMLPSAAI